MDCMRSRSSGSLHRGRISSRSCAAGLCLASLALLSLTLGSRSSGSRAGIHRPLPTSDTSSTETRLGARFTRLLSLLLAGWRSCSSAARGIRSSWSGSSSMSGPSSARGSRRPRAFPHRQQSGGQSPRRIDWLREIVTMRCSRASSYRPRRSLWAGRLFRRSVLGLQGVCVMLRNALSSYQRRRLLFPVATSVGWLRT